MATYAIGDIQGCYTALLALLEKISFDAQVDTLWITGDLVNRGPDSLQVLRYLKQLPGAHKIVLGNHDLHLIACAFGARPKQADDTLDAVLQAPDKDELIAWLRQLPLLVTDEKSKYVMTHAGLAPMWDLPTAQRLAREVERVLQSDAAEELLKNMYGNLPKLWSEDLVGEERWRCIVNYFTRMRFCTADGAMELTYKGLIANKPANLIPWFEVRNRMNTDLNIIFGHWAALGGKAEVNGVFPMDTGYVWGGALTAMRLEDRVKFQVLAKINGR